MATPICSMLRAPNSMMDSRLDTKWQQETLTKKTLYLYPAVTLPVETSQLKFALMCGLWTMRLRVSTQKDFSFQYTITNSRVTVLGARFTCVNSSVLDHF